MFDVERLQAIQDDLKKVECIGKSRLLLDIMQDRE